MDSSLQELQQIFEYELKRKLSERSKTSSGEMKILLNGFKFLDLNYTGIIDKNQWIEGIFRTGLSGFSEADLDSLFTLYDKNNTGQIDYKNFCAFLYGREPLNPLENQSLKIQQNNNNIDNNINQNDNNQNMNMNNNMNQTNQYEPIQNQDFDMNMNSNMNNNRNMNNNMNMYNNMNQMNEMAQYQESQNINNNINNYQNNINYSNIQSNPNGNFNEVNNNRNNMNSRQKTPIYNNNQYNNLNQRNQNNYNNQNSNNYRNNQQSPMNMKNYDDYQENSNFRQSQRIINGYNNTFNNIFQQEVPSTNNNDNNDNSEININNLNENKIKSIITSIKNSINTNNGVTFYTFIKKLKNKQLNNSGISLNDLYSIFQEMRINISLNDLKILFYILSQNQNNVISTEQLINIIKGNLDERRKLYIIGIFSKIDTEKKGEVSLQLLKNMYNAKNHPDVLNGTKSQEEAFEQFCYSLDLYCELNDIQKNGNFSFQNFVDYYSGVSSCIPDEVYFEDMMKGVWNNNNILSNNFNYNNINNLNINNNTNNDINKIGINSILMGIKSNERNRNNSNNNQFNNNRFNNNKFNNNDNQFKNNSNRINNNNNQFNNNRRMKNSMSSQNVLENNNIESNNQNSSNFSNTMPINQKINTPFNNYNKTPEGIKVFKNKRRYNPITDEYYNDSESISTNNKTINNENTINNNYSNNQNSFDNINNSINQNNNINNNNTSGIIDQLRNALILRGPKSIFTFQRMLSIYDRNHSGQISLDDFYTIFQTYNLNFSNSDIQNIFKIFDTNQTGSINYDLMLNNILGEMNERRILSLKKVFDNFSKNEQGEVLMSEIKQKFNSGRHPDVVNDKKSKEEVYGEFLDKLEIFREYNDNLKASFSTTMNFNEFAKFYSEISMNIKDDNLFDYMLNNCWDLDRSSRNNINNGNWNNNNYYNNNNNSNYDNNIRARTGKQIMNMNNRPY